MLEAGPNRTEEMSHEQFWAHLRRKAAERHVPIGAMLELTYGCNLRCVHCYNPTHTAKGELATDKLRAIIDQLADLGCFRLSFTGGEIFTHRDALELFAYARTKGITLILLTNATLITPEKADRIRALQPSRVEISIYGATEETYECITRIPGSFNAFMRGVQLLRERRIPLFIKMPVMTLNLHEVQQAKELVHGWGVKFVYCTEIHPRVDGSLEPLQYRITPEEVIRIDTEMGVYRNGPAEGGGGQEEHCGGMQQGLFTCNCGKTSFAVTPYGQMNLCVSLATPKYDLQTGTVAEGWRALVEFVDRANAQPGEAYECPTCTVQGHCRQGPMNAFLETGDLSPCLPYFKELAGVENQAYEAASRRERQGSGQGGDSEETGSGTRR